LLAIGVEDLDLDAALGGVFLDVLGADEDAAVAALAVLVFEVDDEVAIRLFSPEVAAVALPAFFPGPRREAADAVLLPFPVPFGLPGLEVLAVECGVKIVGGGGETDDKEGGEEESGALHGMRLREVNGCRTE